MTTLSNDAHEPARAAHEAAMLPAMAKQQGNGRLLYPGDETAFRPVDWTQEPVSESASGSGSMAGRAVLHSFTLPGIDRMRSGKRPGRRRPGRVNSTVQVVPVDCYLCRR